MSLFNDLARTALGSLTGNTAPGGGNPLMQIAGELITNHSSGNGLSGLLQQLTQGGLGAQAASWVGTGENQPVSGEQIHQALGAEQIGALAQKVGLPPGQVSAALAQFLPQIVDRLTPHGQVPQSGGLESALGGVLQSDWFRQLASGH
jgi:uncharacterized protein YidB (DUF937 family)